MEKNVFELLEKGEVISPKTIYIDDSEFRGRDKGTTGGFASNTLHTHINVVFKASKFENSENSFHEKRIIVNFLTESI